MKKKYLSILFVGVLASCGSTQVKGLVENGETFSTIKIANVPSEVQEFVAEDVKGVKINSQMNNRVTTVINGEKTTVSSPMTMTETYDFVNKKLTCTESFNGQNYKYEVSIVNDTISFVSKDFTEDSLNFDLTLEGVGALFESCFNSVFSWNFFPSTDDVASMQETLNKVFSQLGFSIEFEGLEEIVDAIAYDTVMSGDFEHGNFEVGFGEPHDYVFSMKMTMADAVLSTSTVNLRYTKMRYVFKNYLLREAVLGMSESFVFTIDFGEDVNVPGLSMSCSSVADGHYTYTYF